MDGRQIKRSQQRKHAGMTEIKLLSSWMERSGWMNRWMMGKWGKTKKKEEQRMKRETGTI